MLAPAEDPDKHSGRGAERGATGARRAPGRLVASRPGGVAALGEDHLLVPALRTLTQQGHPGHDDRRDEGEHDRILDGRRTVLPLQTEAEPGPAGLRIRREAQEHPNTPYKVSPALR